MTLLMIDVDHFKIFNDTFGHGAGDECLRTLAQALQKNLRRADELLARFGGEEFAVVLPETTAEQAGGLGNHLRRVVAGLDIANPDSPVAPWVTISVGGATMTPKKKTSPQTLVDAADNNMYKAKRLGRNQYCGEQ